MSEIARWAGVDYRTVESSADRVACLWWQGWNTTAIAGKLGITPREVRIARYGRDFVREWEEITARILGERT
jgi:hypothetical protein